MTRALALRDTLSMRDVTDEELREHHVHVATDNRYQRKARMLQALWRERKGYPAGTAGARGVLGSRLAMPGAKERLWNYLSEGTRQVVRSEVLDRTKSRGKVYQAPRIFDNLLSSQPLCFNLFAELSLDLPAATKVLRRLLGARVERVLRVEFEHSPGRRDPRFTADASAFDVYVEYERAEGGLGFVGIEVKYHEGMGDEPATHRERYDEVATAMGCFVPASMMALRRKPLNQIWRDHMLVGSLLSHAEHAFREGHFALVYPSENELVRAAVRAYRECLAKDDTFLVWKLEEVVEALAAEVADARVYELRGRYLGER